MVQGHVLQAQFWAIRKQLLGELDSQAEAVKVEVCVSVPETLMCVAFTPSELELASVHYRAF